MFELVNTKTYRLLFIFALIGTLLLTLSVPVGIIKSCLINDKVAHGITFFVLAFLYSHSQGKTYGIGTVMILASFGLLIEFIQYFLPWRSFSLFDWLADIIGIIGYDVIHRLKTIYLARKH